MPDFIAQNFNIFLIAMAIIAVIVFIALFFVNAGYGIFRNKNWGPSIPNKLGWILMESPVFILMCVLFFLSDRTSMVTCWAFSSFSRPIISSAPLFSLSSSRAERNSCRCRLFSWALFSTWPMRSCRAAGSSTSPLPNNIRVNGYIHLSLLSER